jgi:hypothetical protein
VPRAEKPVASFPRGDRGPAVAGPGYTTW